MHTPVLFTATPGTYGVNAALEQQTLDMSVLVTGRAVPKYIFKYIYFIYFSYTLFIRPRGWRHQWSMVDNAPSLSPYCLLTFAHAVKHWETEKEGEAFWYYFPPLLFNEGLLLFQPNLWVSLVIAMLYKFINKDKPLKMNHLIFQGGS